MRDAPRWISAAGGAEIGVRDGVAQDVVGGDEQTVRDGDDRLLVAAPLRELGGDLGGDLGVEPTDLGIEEVDLAQETREQEGVVGGEAPGQCLVQRHALGPQPRPRQLGKHRPVPFAGEQRGEHRTAGDYRRRACWALVPRMRPLSSSVIAGSPIICRAGGCGNPPMIFTHCSCV